jgi:ABC-type glutathione transport system ATPase component
LHTTSALVDVQDLTVTYLSEKHPETKAVSGATLSLSEGESLGILGESGSGKSSICLALLGLLGREAVVSGRLSLAGHDADLSRRDLSLLRAQRGKVMSFIPQDAHLALNPVLRVGTQVAEVARAHGVAGRAEHRRAALEALTLAGFDEPAQIYSAYPHQLSGGQKQRVLIAQAIVNRPQVIIADEPTASLDPALRSLVIDLLKRLQTEMRVSLLIVSHDLGLLAALCDRLLVMYAGKIAESGTTDSVLRRPQHPYTRALLACGVRDETSSSLRLKTIAREALVSDTR